jgi:1-acyl-sn-glycerol-3-phosphate acyltransferase
MRFPKEGTRTWKLLYIVAIIIKPFFVRLNIEGEENVPPAGGCVIACNHTLGADYVVLGYASPRQIYYMAKAEIFAIHPLLAKLVAGAGAFPVQRGKGDIQAIEQAITMVKAGKIVGMFPEGTRSRGGGLRRAKPGAARIALGANAPIVPAAVVNGDTILRDFLKFQRRPSVTVRFGRPLAPVGSVESQEDIQQLTTTIMLAIAELLPPEQRGYYADGESLTAEERVSG